MRRTYHYYLDLSDQEARIVVALHHGALVLPEVDVRKHD